MSYGTEADYRAALRAYLALHEVFYRFHKRLNTMPPTGIAEGGRELTSMSDTLVPALAARYGGPAIHVARLAETLEALSRSHASSPGAPFDARLAYQAYVDVDNILLDLLRSRAEYTSAFDEETVGIGPASTALLPRESERGPSRTV